jgi:hypothetical protein
MPFGFGRRQEPGDQPTEVKPTKAEVEAPGWDAIDTALAKILPGQQPLHWGTNRLPGQDGLYGLSAYRQGDHWFFVSYGLSELFAKESEDKAVSGWGFELTMRAVGADAEPPAWPRALLDRLGSVVYSSGRPFGVGHRLDAVSQITGGNPPTRLTCIAFTEDPKLGTIETPNGSVTFLAVVGITPDELAEMKASTTATVLDAMRSANPLLITSPLRNPSTR